MNKLTYFNNKINRFLRNQSKSIYQKYKKRESSQRKLVVFLAGVQRSGTNLVMDLLDKSWEADVYHETDPRAFNNYNMKPIDEIKQLVDSSNASYVVVKSLLELQRIKDIRSNFLRSKIIWVIRFYGDVVNSQTHLWNKMPEIIGGIVEDRESVDWRGQLMSDETYEKVCKLYHEGISNESACALFWYFRNVLFFEQGLDKDKDVYVIQYENLVNEPGRIVPGLFEFVGLPYKSSIVSSVFSTSISKSKKPKVQEEIAELCESLQEKFDMYLSI